MNSRPSIRKIGKGYMGSGGGVSAGRVLAAGGIARGGVVRVKPTVKPKPVVAAATSPKVEKKSDECMPPVDERGNGMKPEEKRLADFLEAAQDAKAKCEETNAPPEPAARLVEEMIRNADPPPTEEPTVEATGVEERREKEEVGYEKAVLPELPFGEVEQPKKKRRRRKGRKAKAEEGELKLTEVAI